MDKAVRDFVHQALCPRCGPRHVTRLVIDLELFGIEPTEEGLRSASPSVLDAIKADAYRPRRSTEAQRAWLKGRRESAIEGAIIWKVFGAGREEARRG